MAIVADEKADKVPSSDSFHLHASAAESLNLKILLLLRNDPEIGIIFLQAYRLVIRAHLKITGNFFQCSRLRRCKSWLSFRHAMWVEFQFGQKCLQIKGIVLEFLLLWTRWFVAVLHLRCSFRLGSTWISVNPLIPDLKKIRFGRDEFFLTLMGLSFFYLLSCLDEVQLKSRATRQDLEAGLDCAMSS